MALLLTLIYLISAFACWYWIYLAYGLNGIKFGYKPNLIELSITLIPYLNTLCMIYLWLDKYPLEK